MPKISELSGVKIAVVSLVCLIITSSFFMLSGCSDDDDDDSAGEVIVDIRADVNRNGTIDLMDPTEDMNEDTWDANHGAIFLANIDDDEQACPTTGTNDELAACNDAADEVVNGELDLMDMARLKTVPWPEAPDNSRGMITMNEPGCDYVRLFRNFWHQ